MGRAYFVPRSAKGESRILYIFTIKSFVVTLVFGLFGVLIYFLINQIIGMGMVPGIILIGVFAAVGFAIATLKIPDSPIMGRFRKAGGENLGDIIIRFLTFKNKRKIYIYDLNRGGK